jgi:hypothetical protein
MIRLRQVLGGITVSIVPIRYFWGGARDSTRQIQSARISNMQAPQPRPGIIVIALLNTFMHSSPIVSIPSSAMPALSYPNSWLCTRHTQTPSNASHILKSLPKSSRQNATNTRAFFFSLFDFVLSNVISSSSSSSSAQLPHQHFSCPHIGHTSPKSPKVHISSPNNLGKYSM